MNEPIDINIETVRAEALRKLGRNIVNFSKIEALLKYLLSVSQFEGTDETISKQFRENQARLNKQTLGKLVQEFHKNVVVDTSQAEITTTSSESHIAFYFKITCHNSNFLKSWKRAPSDIVVERNRLIHQDLALLDTSSVEDYRKLISLLDEQNPRLLDHLEKLGSIIELVRNGWKTFEDFLESPEFFQYMQSNQIDI